jgi:hypothetical protein
MAAALATGALLLCEACASSGDCTCPSTAGITTIQLPCNAITPSVGTTGACTAQAFSPETTAVQATGAGACQVALTFDGGTPLSVDLDFTLGSWLACGADLHGCGQEIVASTPNLILTSQCPAVGSDGG